MWYYKDNRVRAECDACQHKDSVTGGILRWKAQESLVAQLKASGWNFIGVKCFCKNCIGRVQE